MKKFKDIAKFIGFSTMLRSMIAIAALCPFMVSSSLWMFSKRRQAGSFAMRPAHLPQRVRKDINSPAPLSKMVLALILLIFTATSVSALPAGTVVSNRASLTVTYGAAAPVTINSNAAVFTISANRTSALIEFMQYAPLLPSAEQVPIVIPDYEDGGGTFAPMAAPVPFGTFSSLSPGAPAPLVNSQTFHAGGVIFIRLTDLDQNVDSTVVETVIITLSNSTTGDMEKLRLYETGVDTGQFIGYLTTTSAVAVANNAMMSVAEDSSVIANYIDVADSTDTEITAALVDPFGLIFDSRSGAVIDGAVVTLINTDTGNPADVFGDDGISVYPSTLISGQAGVQDSGGNIYNLPPGTYRFPYVRPGNYRLDVTPPSGYKAPSTVSTADIQSLPGAPFSIVNPGSRGEVFRVNPGPALHIDYPVDFIITGLYIQKKAGKDLAAPGDFVPYNISVFNGTTSIVKSALVKDMLPLGFAYAKGSAKLDGITISDPSHSDDGRTLFFNLSSLPVASTVELKYVLEVGAGARPGYAENIAMATGAGGVVSNIATAKIMIREDLFRGESIIVGRVMADSCGVEDGEKDKGVAGIRIFLEDGSFIMTDREGRFHFEGIAPGTHVVQIDEDTVPPMYEIISCNENTRFAGRTYSQFIDVQGGTLWRADFNFAYKPKLKGAVELELKSSLSNSGQAPSEEEYIDRDMFANDEGASLKEILSEGALEGEKNVTSPAKISRIDYEIPISVNGNVDLAKLRMTVMLPKEAVYLQGSSRLSGEVIDDPSSFANALTFRLGAAERAWHGVLTFSAEIPVEGGEGELFTKAILTFDTPEKKNVMAPMLENSLKRVREEKRIVNPDILLRPEFDTFSNKLTDKDKLVLDDIVEFLKPALVLNIEITGHTDSVPIRADSRKWYKDNYDLSEARAGSVANYISEALGLDKSEIIVLGVGSDIPIASNDTKEGRKRNRRVEIKVTSEKIIKWTLLEQAVSNSGSKEVSTVGLRPGEASEEIKKVEVESEFDRVLADDTPGTEIVWPVEGAVLPNYYIWSVVKHGPEDMVRLYHNGEELHPISFQGVTKNSEKGIAKSIWRGILLEEGKNRIEAFVFDGSGKQIKRLEREVYYAGLPVSAELVEDKSRLRSDGMKGPVIAVRLLDKWGKPVRPGLMGEYNIDPPFMSADVINALEKNPLSGPSRKALRYTVGEDGVALIKLAPTTKSGQLNLRMKLADGEKKVGAWISPELRDWILVGFAEGTAGYNTVSGNMDTMKSLDGEDELYSSARTAFYAKGRIKGNWLLTAAYDSDKNKETERELLHQKIDPGKYYLVYGDGSSRSYDAASADKLYIKMERDEFYAMYGDYNTGLTLTELARYNRSMNGFKSEFKGKNIDFNIYAAETANAFMKDELRGDGTSGLYKLSRNNVVVNSESMEVEVRDRFRSEVIISSRKLNRYMDYSIDYDEGTIYFREPMYSRDENFNPIYIVVDYETNNTSERSMNYGGRGALKTAKGRIETGVSYIHEGSLGGEGDLSGMDLKIKLTDKIDLMGEFAESKKELYGIRTSGQAYKASIDYKTGRNSTILYFRQQEAGFGLGQQKGSEEGTRKAGVDGKYSIAENISLNASMFRITNLATEAERDHGEVRMSYNERKYSLFAGMRKAVDSFADGTVNQSTQFMFGSKLSAVKDRLNLRLNHDQSIIGSNENADYPSRTLLGSDFKLNGSMSLFADQEFTNGAVEDSQSTRLGLKSTPWTGATVNTNVDRRFSENGERLFSNFGLKQTMKLDERWSADAGLDHTKTLKTPGNNSQNLSVPPASGGSEDFTAYSLGLSYLGDKWSATSRTEMRMADNSDKYGLHLGANRELKSGVAFATGVRAFMTYYVTGDEKSSGDVRFSIASRPEQSRWIVLDRLDLVYGREKTGGTKLDSWKIINNLNTNYKMNYKTMIALQYGSKYVKENIDGLSYKGYTDLTGIESIYDITRKIDLGLRFNMLHSWRRDKYDYSSGLAAGYNFAENVWASLGYNFFGFTDSDFSRADYTAQGPYIKFRIKFDQQTARELATWMRDR